MVATPAPVQAGLQTFEGQIVHRRKVASTLLFYDLLFTSNATDSSCTGNASELIRDREGAQAGVTQDGITCVLKLARSDGSEKDGWTPAERFDAIRASLKHGDLVRVTGRLDLDNGRLQCHDIVVMQAWITANPNTEFVPYPLSSMKKPQADTSATRQACKKWLNTGRCPAGDTCSYLHPSRSTTAAHASATAGTQSTVGESNPEASEDGLRRSACQESREQWLAQRRAARRAAAEESGDTHAGDPAAKRHRAGVFADWLLATFGRAALEQGSGVLDVAGGRGSLSFELWTRRGVRSTVVDPRPQRATKEQAQLLRGRGPGADQAARRGPAPHLRRHFEAAMWTEESEEGRVAREASVVVGMHPDQALEPILEFALALNKPFAVVPCCAFPRLFPDRFLLVPAEPRAPSTPTSASTSTGAHPSGQHAPATPAPSRASTLPSESPSASANPSLTSTQTLLSTSLQAQLAPDSTELVENAPAQRTGAGHAAPAASPSPVLPPPPPPSWDAAAPPLPVAYFTGTAKKRQVVTTADLVQHICQKVGSRARTAYLQFEGRNQVVYRVGEAPECGSVASPAEHTMVP